VKKTSVPKAPYAPDGSLLHFPRDYHPFSHYEDTATGERLERSQIWEPLDPPIIGSMFMRTERQIRDSWKQVYLEPEWRDNVPFRADFQIYSIASGGSARYLILKSANAPLDLRTWPIFVTDLVDVLRRAGAERGAVLSGRWMVAKRGQNYGLRLANE